MMSSNTRPFISTCGHDMILSPTSSDEATDTVSESDFKAKQLIDDIRKEISERGADLVKTIKAVYCFRVQKGNKLGVWVIDVKNGMGSVHFDLKGRGDVTFTMEDDDWVKLLVGKLNPQEAYFRGQLKLTGNISLAMKLQNLLRSKELKSKL